MPGSGDAPASVATALDATLRCTRLPHLCTRLPAASIGVALGCTSFVIEFFGRDTRGPARLFAEQVMPAFPVRPAPA